MVVRLTWDDIKAAIQVWRGSPYSRYSNRLLAGGIALVAAPKLLELLIPWIIGSGQQQGPDYTLFSIGIGVVLIIASFVVFVVGLYREARPTVHEGVVTIGIPNQATFEEAAKIVG